MGVAESKILANNLLSACSKAEREGKHRLDESQFWKDAVSPHSTNNLKLQFLSKQETIKASKSIYEHIPQRIRRTPRQSAIKKAIASSSQQVQAPQVVQDLQDERESLFPLNLSTNGGEAFNGSASTRQNVPFLCHVPTLAHPSPLADFYKLLLSCEHQQQLGKIRLRICYVAFFRLKNAVQPGTQYQYDDASMFIARLIRDSGCVDSLSDIEHRVRRWVGLGERYSLLANDLGGLGVLYLLPDDGGESIWTKELPKSAKKPGRIAMLNHLRQKLLPEEAERRGLHALAESEAAKVLGPIQASLDRVMENHLSEANFHTVNKDRQPNRAVSNWPRSESPQPRQLSTGTPLSRSGVAAATQIAPAVESPRTVMFSDQVSSERVQDVRESPYEPSLAQTSVQDRPDLMSRFEPGYMPSGSISCDTHIPHFGNTAVDDSAQFNVEGNGQVVSHYSQPSGRRQSLIILKQYSDPTSVTSNQIAMIAPADFPQAFAVTSTPIPADYPQLFPYQQGTVTPADYPVMFPNDPSQYLSCSSSQQIVQSL